MTFNLAELPMIFSLQYSPSGMSHSHTLAQLRAANNSLKVGMAPVSITSPHPMIGGVNTRN